MLDLFLIVAFAAGPEFVAGISGGKNLVVFALIQSITFAGGIFIILAGVRLILGEIVPAFRGIAMKLVPNAKPALGAPAILPGVVPHFFCGATPGYLGMQQVVDVEQYLDHLQTDY